ncbi:carbohydrate ABC transporter permease [Microbacterium sp. RU33B]|uniref:carbohydrate ABC transporter permease n=1 Tax=Microbacterium sp. RU33B TaxID=1907390 RepID=UPI000968A443|nr:sugar ABC transporter permease [Microbacterium sp. RU33B]SIT67439.1 carbohydrate ABC transporter membrane protein 1, CUT1 family [Microbacterium sp. RU33B]
MATATPLTSPTPARTRRRAVTLRRPAVGAAFVLPAAVVVLLLFIVPLCVLIFMSFQDWPLLGSPEPNGLDNYTSIPDNELFIGAIGFTLLYTVLATVIIFLVSFCLVAVAGSQRRGAKFYRTTFFLPYVVGTASAGLIWYSAVNDQTGIANTVLQVLGLSDGPWGFLSTPEKALFTTLTLVVWKFIGFQVIVLVVGLQSIPGELYEAARLDGANTWHRLRYITFPFLKPTLALLLILSVTGSLLSFDQFMVLTRGGPDNSTITMVYALYNTAFVSFDLGRAAALSVILLIALVLLNVIQLAVLRKRGSDD